MYLINVLQLDISQIIKGIVIHKSGKKDSMGIELSH